MRSLKQSSATLALGSSASSDSPDGSAVAAAEGDISLRGAGTVTATIEATAVSTAAARSVLIERFAAAIVDVEGGGLALAIAEVEAAAYAFAVAESTASTAITLTSTGQGAMACATAFANATASADAFARVIVEVCRIGNAERPAHFCRISRYSLQHPMISISRMPKPRSMPLSKSRFLLSLLQNPKPAARVSSSPTHSSTSFQERLPYLTSKSSLWRSPSLLLERKFRSSLPRSKAMSSK